jgi:hypothetical protein
MNSASIQSRPELVDAVERRPDCPIILRDERTALRKGLSANEGSALIGVGVVASGSTRFTTGHLHFFMPHGEHAHHAHHGHTSHQESNGHETSPAEHIHDADSLRVVRTCAATCWPGLNRAFIQVKAVGDMLGTTEQGPGRAQ